MAVRHLLFPGRDQIALVVRGQPREERRDVDDVGVGGDSERLGDLGGPDDREVTVGHTAALGGGERWNKRLKRGCAHQHAGAGGRCPTEELPVLRT
jgi:hypothetical protein